MYLLNIYGKRSIQQQCQLPSTLEQGIENHLNKLLDSLQTVHKTFQVPLILGICPPSPQLRAILSDQVVQRLETLIQQATNELNRITTVRFSDYESLYGWVDYYDAVRDEMGHIPYTPDFYATMATVLVRQAHALNQPVYKVIALDCDNTLWSGVVGEQGVEGVNILPGFDALQQFMIEQKRQGMLICLVSKNNEADVKSVFTTREDMKLQWQDLTAWKINWLPKSQNLRELAQDLNVGTDSIIFVDDNPVECAEVKANCPEVLTLQLPAQSNHLADFLNHVWAFDKVTVNLREDSLRTEWYQENAKREQFRKTTLTFKDFIADLNLKITLTAAQLTDYARIAQLTHRTNQFNNHKISQSETDIEEMLSKPFFSCDVVRVTDRFGDYGLCGVLISSRQQQKLAVKTILLSCRALGWGVEHQMLAFLGKKALTQQQNEVEIPLVPTEKNRPMETFLQTIGTSSWTQQAKQTVYVFSAKKLSKLVFSPPETEPNTKNDVKILTTRTRWKTPPANESELMQRLANQRSRLKANLPTTEAVIETITANVTTQPEETRLIEETADYINSTILKNVCTILNVDESSLSPTEAFSDIGLDSWGSVDLMAKLGETFGIMLPTTTLFDYTCVTDLSNYITSKYGETIRQNP